MLESQLDILGYRGQPVANRFLRQEKDTSHLALVFPGYGYGVDMPVLYYPIRLLSDRGADVLMLDLLYKDIEAFRAASNEEQSQWIAADALALLETGLRQKAYDRVTLIGKSMGTLAMGWLVETETQAPFRECIWLTPLVQDPRLQQQISACATRGLMVIGDADRFYDAEILERIEDASGNPSLIIPNADHALLIPGKVEDSLHALEYLIEAIDALLV